MLENVICNWTSYTILKTATENVVKLVVSQALSRYTGAMHHIEDEQLVSGIVQCCFSSG